MKRLTAIAALFAVLLTPVQAIAADKKVVIGALSMLGGGLLMVAAYDYDTSCPDGYTTHTVQGAKTQCVYIDQYGSDVRDQPTSATYARPTLMKSGVAAVGVGVLLLLLPRGAQRAPSISLTPNGWLASNTFGF